MNWVDIVVALILLLFFIAGIRKGLIREVSGLVSIIAAFILGITGAPIWSDIMVDRLKIPPSVATLVAFILIFILVFILVRALGNLLFKVVRATPLDALDRLGGGFIGTVKGALIISLVLVFLGLFTLPEVFYEEMNDSWSAAPLRAVAPSLYRFAKGAIPQMRSLGEVLGDSVEKGLSRGRREILKRSSHVIDQLQDSKSKEKASSSPETTPNQDTQ
jgi:membrane protein required for colicin V production